MILIRKTRQLLRAAGGILMAAVVVIALAGCASGKSEVEAAQKAVDALYLPYQGTWSETSTRLASDVTTATIDVVNRKIEALKDGTQQKPTLQKMVSTARTMYADQLIATDKVASLYNNGKFFVNSKETSSTLDAAKAAVSKVTNPDKKASLDTTLTACVAEYKTQQAAAAALAKVAAPAVATPQLIASAQAAISKCKSPVAKSALEVKLKRYSSTEQVSAAQPGGIYTPEKGSLEHQALMDAARAFDGWTGQYTVYYLQVSGDWAVGHLAPYNPPTVYERGYFIWKKTGGKWKCLPCSGGTAYFPSKYRTEMREGGAPKSLIEFIPWE